MSDRSFLAGDTIRALNGIDYVLVDEIQPQVWRVKYAGTGKVLPDPCALPEHHMTLVKPAPDPELSDKERAILDDVMFALVQDLDPSRDIGGDVKARILFAALVAVGEPIPREVHSEAGMIGYTRAKRVPR